MANKTEIATFAAGCFWGIEYKFSQVNGVINTMVGYTGGHFKNPSYEDVCSDETGHAEAVQVEFNPLVVSYEKLLDLFWIIHDPTQWHRQGPDVGSQYRSAIFFYTPSQETTARASLVKLQQSGHFSRPVITQIELARKFYRAEEYHQQYLAKQGIKNCHIK